MFVESVPCRTRLRSFCAGNFAVSARHVHLLSACGTHCGTDGQYSVVKLSLEAHTQQGQSPAGALPGRSPGWPLPGRVSSRACRSVFPAGRAACWASLSPPTCSRKRLRAQHCPSCPGRLILATALVRLQDVPTPLWHQHTSDHFIVDPEDLVCSALSHMMCEPQSVVHWSLRVGIFPKQFCRHCAPACRRNSEAPIWRLALALVQSRCGILAG